MNPNAYSRSAADSPLDIGSAQTPHLAAGTQTAGSVVVVVLVDFKTEATLWGWSRLVMQRWALRRIAGLKFSKVLGSGFDGGFGLRPSRTRQGLFLGFDTEAEARDFIAASPVLAGYRSHARELCVVLLRVCSCRGSWSGASLEITAELPVDGPVASLTRASIRPSRARQFWRMQPASEVSPGHFHTVAKRGRDECLRAFRRAPSGHPSGLRRPVFFRVDVCALRSD